MYVCVFELKTFYIRQRGEKKKKKKELVLSKLLAFKTRGGEGRRKKRGALIQKARQ